MAGLPGLKGTKGEPGDFGMGGFSPSEVSKNIICLSVKQIIKDKTIKKYNFKNVTL